MSSLKQINNKERNEQDEAGFEPTQKVRRRSKEELYRELRRYEDNEELKTLKRLNKAVVFKGNIAEARFNGNDIPPASEDKPKEQGAKKKDKYAFKLFDADHVRRSIPDGNKAISTFRQQKQDEVLKKMAGHSGYVQSRALPKEYLAIMDDMDDSFPHFKHVTECLRQRMQLKACHRHPVLQFGINILLDGPAGVGKSAYLMGLSQKLGTVFHSVSCASASNGMDIKGLSAKWGNGQHGKIHDLLFNHECPNPIILLDEVEKSSETNSPFVSVLYELLEKNNARIFKDEYVQVSMDASAINWFATCNYIDRLDAPIRDRFEVLTVQAPKADDLKKIVPNLYKNIVRSHELESVFAARLEDNVVNELALKKGISIRRIGSALETALARAVARSGDVRKSRRKVRLEVTDIPEIAVSEVCQQPMGFVWG